MNKIIWVSWETHRRTQELAKAFGAELFTFLYDDKSYFRYPILLFKTTVLLIQRKPDALFVQNPSIVLAAIASFLKPFFGYRLIVDRHSNFKLATLNSRTLKWQIFHLLSRYSIKKANITIVTNEALFNLINDWQGKAFILQDKLPKLPRMQTQPLNGDFNIVCVATFSPDEPIFEIVKAAMTVSDRIHIYITGSFKNYQHINKLIKIMPKNVTTTGFLPEKDYLQLLNSVDVVMALTTEENLLTCGAYEAIALKKPMILSNTKAITNYFYKGAIYTAADPQSIAQSILDAQKQHEYLTIAVNELFDELSTTWQHKYSALLEKLN